MATNKRGRPPIAGDGSTPLSFRTPNATYDKVCRYSRRFPDRSLSDLGRTLIEIGISAQDIVPEMVDLIERQQKLIDELRAQLLNAVIYAANFAEASSGVRPVIAEIVRDAMFTALAKRGETRTHERTH